MKKTGILMVAATFSSCLFAQDASNLKVVQTGRFAVNYEKVGEAVKELCLDGGGQGSLIPKISGTAKKKDSGGFEMTCMLKGPTPDAGGAMAAGAAQSAASSAAASAGASAIPFIGSIFSIASAAKSVSDQQEMMATVTQVRYDITATSAKSTTVRIRLYQMDQAQVTNAAAYDAEFTKLGKALGTEALPIEN